MFPLLASHTRLVLALVSLLNYRRFAVTPLMTRVYRRTDQDLRDLTGARDRKWVVKNAHEEVAAVIQAWRVPCVM